MSLWFRGDNANSADWLFVVNGVAVYGEAPSATQLQGRNEWVLNLQTFADQGVDLANVNAISIGISPKNAPSPGGGTGTPYFDDIMLVR